MRLRDALVDALAGGPAVALTSLHTSQVPEDVALIIDTGGTSGKPKSVALTSHALRASATLSNQSLGALDADRWSLALPLHHIAGVNQLLRSIALGTEPVIRGGEFISIVPTQLHRALRDNDEFLDELRGAKAVLIGGAQVSRALLDRGSAAGITLVTSYGMTEMCGGCVFDGKALPGVQVRILESGRIALSGPMRATGYLVDGKLSGADVFVDEWFMSNDRGSIDIDGTLQIEGRIDDVIISGGEKIATNAVENFLRSRFPELEIYAMGIPDEQWGQALRIVMTKDAGRPSLSLGELRSLIAESIGRVAAPRSLLLLSEMPTKSNGKIDFAKLMSTEPTESI